MKAEGCKVMNQPLPDPRRIVPDTKWRDTLIAVAAGVVVLSFLIYAVLAMSQQAAAPGMADGIVLGKTFVPQPETQISVGSGGLNTQQVAGEYRLRVRVPSEHDREYTVVADARVYEAHQVGDHLYFKQP